MSRKELELPRAGEEGRVLPAGYVLQADDDALEVMRREKYNTLIGQIKDLAARPEAE